MCRRLVASPCTRGLSSHFLILLWNSSACSSIVRALVCHLNMVHEQRASTCTLHSDTPHPVDLAVLQTQINAHQEQRLPGNLEEGENSWLLYTRLRINALLSNSSG